MIINVHYVDNIFKFQLNYYASKKHNNLSFNKKLHLNYGYMYHMSKNNFDNCYVDGNYIFDDNYSMVEI